MSYVDGPGLSYIVEPLIHYMYSSVRIYTLVTSPLIAWFGLILTVESTLGKSPDAILHRTRHLYGFKIDTGTLSNPLDYDWCSNIN